MEIPSADGKRVRSHRTGTGRAFEFDDVLVCEASGADSRVRSRLERTAERHGLQAIDLPFGAGHDAAVLSNAGVPVGMILAAN